MLGEQIQNTDEVTVLKAIVHISKRKTYQFILILFLGIVFHILNIAMLSPSIVFINPTFTCQGKTKAVSEDVACKIRDFCTINQHQSLTAKLHLYCDGRKNDRNLVQSASGVGNGLGVLMVNWLADRKGKRFCILLSLILASASAYSLFIGILQKSTELVIASQFMIGYAYGAFATLCFFLGSRYLSEFSEYVVLIFYLCGTGTAQISLGLINQFFPGWHAFIVIYIVGFTLTLISAPFIIKEDPVYLYNNAQMKELMQLIETVGDANGATVHQMQAAENELSRINKHRGKRTPELQELVPNQMRQVKIIILILVMACCAFTTNAVYFGIGFQIEKFGLSLTNSMLIFGAAQIVNYLFTMAFMSYLPSIRNLLYISALLPTLACLSFFTQSVTQSIILQVIATAAVRFLITTYGCFYITYYVSHLPKKIEGTSAGLIEGLGCLGKIAAPYSVRIAEDFHLNSMGIFGLIYFVVGFLPLLLLPNEPPQEERLNTSMDDAVK